MHLYNPDETLLAQADTPPGQGHVPPFLVAAGDMLVDRFVLPVEVSTLPPGRYPVRVGLYDPATGDRLVATSNKNPVPDDAFESGWIDREE
ncbi:MAG: hypothetical protein R3C44_18340 [Chloroflexota bacterium]